MSAPNRCYMEQKIEKEGFHYAFHGYSDFEEVEDQRFHELRKEYILASEALAAYMGLKTLE